MSGSASLVLREARLRAGLTQAEMGARAGVAQSVVSAYESGKRDPSFSALEHLAKAAGFDIDVSLRAFVNPSARRERIRLRRDELLETLGLLGAHNVRLFGSVARGEDGPASDIDLLVDLEEGTGLFALARMRREAERILGGSVDIVPSDGLKKSVAAAVLMDAVPV